MNIPVDYFGSQLTYGKKDHPEPSVRFPAASGDWLAPARPCPIQAWQPSPLRDTPRGEPCAAATAMRSSNR